MDLLTVKIIEVRPTVFKNVQISVTFQDFLLQKKFFLHEKMTLSSQF